MTKQTDFKAIWASALDRIKIDIGDEMFNLWFNLTFLKNDGKEVKILAPSSYVRDQLKIRYPGIIETKLQELTGNSFTLDIVVNEEHTEKKAGTPPVLQTVTPSVIPGKQHKEPKSRHPQLKEDNTFDTFIVGDNNSHASGAAQAIARNLGKAYNPLLIYGGVGLGKTHLMQSIGNYVYRTYNNNNIIFVTAENFTNEFIESINDKKSAAAFRNKYRHVDLLMIDDIHSFTKNANSTLDELFNTYEQLHRDRKQIVFTCDRPVSELKNLNERLKSRFDSGLNVDLQPPDFETRCAILKSKIKTKGVFIPEDVITFVCKNISSNVRDLEKALNKLAFYTQLEATELTVEIAKQQLKDNFSPIQSNISIESIISIVADYFSLSMNDLRGKKKTQNIVRPRHLAMYLARDLTEHSTTEIGQAFGGRDHTTVISAIEKIEKKIKSEPSEEHLLEGLKRLSKEYNVK
ncbi:chromosomal replication initiator protein DnaA [Spirochaetia bacterium]|nr:chromosomal replication initiator protein DnaA [Spirochaetia bacterium]